MSTDTNASALVVHPAIVEGYILRQHILDNGADDSSTASPSHASHRYSRPSTASAAPLPTLLYKDLAKALLAAYQLRQSWLVSAEGGTPLVDAFSDAGAEDEATAMHAISHTSVCQRGYWIMWRDAVRHVWIEAVADPDMHPRTCCAAMVAYTVLMTGMEQHESVAVAVAHAVRSMSLPIQHRVLELLQRNVGFEIVFVLHKVDTSLAIATEVHTFDELAQSHRTQRAAIEQELADQEQRLQAGMAADDDDDDDDDGNGHQQEQAQHQTTSRRYRRDNGLSVLQGCEERLEVARRDWASGHLTVVVIPAPSLISSGVNSTRDMNFIRPCQAHCSVDTIGVMCKLVDITPRELEAARIECSS